MRKHGWQLPSHPLQVVAVAVFVALGVAYYVFFAPFVGNKLFQHLMMGLYTPLILCAFSLYIWCAGADPADPGVFKSKKYLKISENKSLQSGESKLDGYEGINTTIQNRTTKIETKSKLSQSCSRFIVLVGFFLCASVCSNSPKEFSEQSEEGMFYCRLCLVEVFKYSKHCRVCDKCVDRFDHHCRWLNNCVGKKNYNKFFTLMVSALLLLVLQWSTGILVLIRCFIYRKNFYLVIASKLGSSFSEAPFVIVVAICTILAMIASVPLVQLFFFHILLIKKGISTYDFIMALKEQEQQGIGSQQSPQMSPASSLTGLSSSSSFANFHRGGAALCTPPDFFLEDQIIILDVVPPGTRSMVVEEQIKKKKPPPVKISPWTLARLDGNQISKAADEARKKSKIIQTVASKRAQFHGDPPDEDMLGSSVGNQQQGTSSSSRSCSDGYEASGGEDSDRGVPLKFVGKSTRWSNHLYSPDIEEERIVCSNSNASTPLRLK